MPFQWATLLDQVTDSTKAYNIPYALGISADSAIASYLGPVKDNTLKSANLAYLKFGYPRNGGSPVGGDMVVVASSVLIGFQVQLLDGNFSDLECNPKYSDDGYISVTGQPFVFRSIGRPFGDQPPGTILYEETVKTIRDDEELLQAANIGSQAALLGTNLDIPDDLMQKGRNYTARIRAILVVPDEVSEFGSDWYLFDGSRPFYTRWGSVRFNVNQEPTATNLTANGQKDPTRLLTGSLNLGFTVNDVDGPRYDYRLQVGREFEGVFAPSVWDTGVVGGGSGVGTKSFSVPYAGQPLDRGIEYSWRVKPSDGLVDGPWSDLGTFEFNERPQVVSVKINDSEILVTDSPDLVVVSNDDPVLEWTFHDAEGEAQKAYKVTYSVSGSAEQFVLSGKNNTNSVTISDLPPGKVITIKITASDSVEDSEEVSVQFFTNATPTITTFLVNGARNPTDVSSTTPTFSWVFQDTDPSDTQQQFWIQVATDVEFEDLVWDTGAVTSSASSVAYGGTPSPVVAPVALTHAQGMYYAKILVYDGVSWSDETDAALSLFAINTKPGTPRLLNPVSTGYFGTIEVMWDHASPQDADGDTVTYSLEYTTSRMSDRGWTFLAGPLPATQSSYAWDITRIPSGDNYGVRVIASDGFSESSPATSPRFTILNHAPNKPIFVTPQEGDDMQQRLRVEWVEANPTDVDGDAVLYELDISANSSDADPTWTTLASYAAGTSKDTIDVSSLESGTDYQLRIRAVDEHGSRSDYELSGVFTINNESVATDFERSNGNLYVSTSDGKLYQANETIWQFSEDWSKQSIAPPFEVFKTPGAVFRESGGELLIENAPGETCIFRQSDDGKGRKRI